MYKEICYGKYPKLIKIIRIFRTVDGMAHTLLPITKNLHLFLY